MHRDYSIHSEGKPVQIIMYDDRMEIKSPGGIYGRIQVDQLGKVQPDTRNPVLAGALEVLKITENRYSGIPTIRRCMREYGLPEPVFEDKRGTFTVKLFRSQKQNDPNNSDRNNTKLNRTKHTNEAKSEYSNISDALIKFCASPRTRKEISDFLGIKSVSYAMRIYMEPLISSGKIKLTIPDKPKSSKQRYTAV